MKQEITLAELTKKLEKHEANLESCFEKWEKDQCNLITLKRNLRNVRESVNNIIGDTSKETASLSLKKNLNKAKGHLEAINLELSNIESHLTRSHETLLMAKRHLTKAQASLVQTGCILDPVTTWLTQSQNERATAQELMEKADNMQKAYITIIKNIASNK
jgi:hypothetical protein